MLLKFVEVVYCMHWFLQLLNMLNTTLQIGAELVTSPSLILLDEPTSGLDSCTALKIVQCLHRLCRGMHSSDAASSIATQGPKVIVCAVHTPSARIFKLFDTVLVLERGKHVHARHVDSRDSLRCTDDPFDCSSRVGLPTKLCHIC